jgi:hypothetical protein
VLEGALRGFDPASDSYEQQQEEVLLMLHGFCSSKHWLLDLAYSSSSSNAASSEAARAAEEATAAAAAAHTAAGAGTAVGPSLLVSCIKLFHNVQVLHVPFTWQAIELAVQVAGMSCAAAEAAQQQQQQ